MKYILMVCLVGAQLLFSSYKQAPSRVATGKTITLVVTAAPHIRELFGANKLMTALKLAGYKVIIERKNSVRLIKSGSLLGYPRIPCARKR